MKLLESKKFSHTLNRRSFTLFSLYPSLKCKQLHFLITWLKLMADYDTNRRIRSLKMRLYLHHDKTWHINFHYDLFKVIYHNFPSSLHAHTTATAAEPNDAEETEK